MQSNTLQHSDDSLRLSAIIETAVDGIIIIDEKGVMELINPAAAKLFGYEIEELIGKNVKVLMPSPHQESHDGYLANYRDTGLKKIIGIGREVDGKKRDGTIFPFRLSISEVKLENKRIFTGIIHDLTAERKAQRELEVEKERAQQYLDVANTIIVVIDEYENIQLLNKRGYELLGYEEGTLIGQNWFDLIIPVPERENIRTVFQQLVEQGNKSYEYFENEVLTKSTNSRLIAWRNAVLTDNKGNTIGAISSGVDITEQRKAENDLKILAQNLEKRVFERTEELAEAVNHLLEINKKLEVEIHEKKIAEAALIESQKELRKAYEKEKELNELKSRFVSMASHEFRTPLSTILSSADLIEAYTTLEKQDKRLKHINRVKSAVSNLIGILNDFLSLGKLEEGQIMEQKVYFELATFIREVIDQLQGMLKPEQHIQVEMNFDHLPVFLDKKFLRNILINLLSNAIKYSTENIDLEVSADNIKKELTINVQDRGIGIPEEEQQHLFTRFFRARNVENIQGTGLGLNIVKRYVELMNGYISFISKTNEGTIFTVGIPLHPIPPDQ